MANEIYHIRLASFQESEADGTVGALFMSVSKEAKQRGKKSDPSGYRRRTGQNVDTARN